ncbi:hypothetical protein H0H92_003437 [Tricholoma furcatifolium]|nr:hypothetical protein H0H92_003437 [Tricholoma furcatifolium]
MDVFRQILAGDSRNSWHKWDITFSVIAKWGPNVIASYGGDPWRRHRRAIGPAFNNNLHRSVWSETLVTYRQMIEDEGWWNRGVVEVPGIQSYTTKLALLVIAKCGFGLPYDWSSPPIDPDGKIFSKRREAHHALTGFLKQEIAARVEEVRSGSEGADERADIFTLLVRANEEDSGKVMLSDEEVIGNVFAMLFAGHETTARTMSATLSLLALHQDIQSEILEHIVSVIGYDHDPVSVPPDIFHLLTTAINQDYSDYEKLNKVLALFFESMRLFPAVYLTLRKSDEDSVLNVPNPIGEEGNTRIAVQKNTLVGCFHFLDKIISDLTPQIILDMIGLHRNPRYFEDPDEFKPSRWYDTHNESEAYPAFGIGPRACIGRKFTTLEAVAFLTMMVRDWHIEPVLKPGETTEIWRERVLSQPVLGITMSVREAPVRLTRRRQALI